MEVNHTRKVIEELAYKREHWPHVLVMGLSDGPGKNWTWEEEDEFIELLKEMHFFAVPIITNHSQAENEYVVPSNRGTNFSVFAKTDGARAVFDISGGNCALEVLPHLRHRVIQKSGMMLWGYSDVSVVMNGLYKNAGIPSVLYQTRFLMGTDEKVEERRKLFKESVFLSEDHLIGAEDVLAGKVNGGLFDFSYTFLQGKSMEGVLLGGNARCFLKLAGTPYMPDLTRKILLLEGLGGDRYAVSSYFAQLSFMGVFEQVAGVLLGTFIQLEKEDGLSPAQKPYLAYRYLERYIPGDLPVAYTAEIGHGINSKAALIGAKVLLKDGEPVHYEKC